MVLACSHQWLIPLYVFPREERPPSVCMKRCVQRTKGGLWWTLGCAAEARPREGLLSQLLAVLSAASPQLLRGRPPLQRAASSTVMALFLGSPHAVMMDIKEPAVSAHCGTTVTGHTCPRAPQRWPKLCWACLPLSSPLTAAILPTGVDHGILLHHDKLHLSVGF